MLNCRLGVYGGHSEGLVTECKDYTPTTAPWSQAEAAHFRNSKHTPAGPRRHHSQLSILCRLHSFPFLPGPGGHWVQGVCPSLLEALEEVMGVFSCPLRAK